MQGSADVVEPQEKVNVLGTIVRDVDNLEVSKRLLFHEILILSKKDRNKQVFSHSYIVLELVED